MELKDSFLAHFRAKYPVQENDKLLLACSGGIDSVVLVDLLSISGVPFDIAHVNYGLREKESDEDAHFVKTLANQYGVGFHLYNTSSFSAAKGGSPQLWAREERYAFFDKLIEEKDYLAVLTAHQADDAWETFLINATRGTGLKGLQGIPAKENKRWRPLLPFGREDIQKYATSRGLRWREDRTNRESDYLRNFIRNQISPLLQERLPKLIDQIQLTQTHLQQSAQFLEQYQEWQWNKHVNAVHGGWSLDLRSLQQEKDPAALLFLLLEPYGFNHLKDLQDLLMGQSGIYLESKEYTLTKNRECLELRQQEEKDENTYILQEGQLQLDSPIRLELETVSHWEKGSDEVLFADKQTLNFPLEVRKWREGDYFYPIGMQGRKKIAKLFKDEKIARPDKEKIWLLLSKGEVVWVIGMRSDRRFQIQPSTQEMIKITWRRD